MSNNPLAPKRRHKGLETWIHAAHMSRAAYRSATWNLNMGAAGWTESGYLHGKFSFGAGWAYSAEDGILEIAIAGTKGLLDLWSDASSWFPNRWEELPRGWWVGYGMVRGPRAAWADLMGIVSSLEHRGLSVKEIQWDGHSKGGGEAQLCHAACRVAGLVSSCTAIEAPRVFKPFARDRYRHRLNQAGNCGCDVLINTVGGRRDAVTAWPRTLKHGGDLNVLGEDRVYYGDDALERWREIKSLENRERGPLKGRYDAHGLKDVIDHMEELLELQGHSNNGENDGAT